MARTEALNKIVITFRKKDGEDYELDSLRVMVTAIERYLSEILKAPSKFLKEEPDYSDNNAKPHGQIS